MKTKSMITITAIALLSFSSFAAPKKIKFPRKVKAACAKVELDDEQKKAIKDLRKRQRKKSRKLRNKADLKNLRLSYKALISDQNATLADAQDISDQIHAARTKLLKIRQAVKNEILFEVVTAEQRPQMNKCIKMKAKHKQKLRAKKRKKKNKNRKKHKQLELSDPAMIDPVLADPV